MDEGKIWLSSLLGSVGTSISVWLVIVAGIPNCWYRINSTGQHQWMILQTLWNTFLVGPFKVSANWTHWWLLVHNIYFMALSGLLTGIIIAAIVVAVQRRNNVEK
jgi:hypothetical protein